jgi:ribA/ribD-fused uncharacterized protein
MKYTFFYNGPFSNWEPSIFTVDDITYNCAEQYMMYKKAELFDDKEAMQQIMKEKYPGDQKAIGRRVKNFKREVWDPASEDIMAIGLKAKFEQNPHLMKELIKVKDTILVEASPYDRIWGIGYSKENALSYVDKWGENRLGKVLNRVIKELGLW